MAMIQNRITNVLLGLVLLALLSLIAMFATGVRGGPLDPPGAPTSTMRTLDEVTGAWNRDLSAVGGCNSPRFQCVLNDEAVLDRGTGLVWERFPSSFGNAFSTAVSTCVSGITGGVKGWRLPAAEELMSLMKPGASNPALPTGHPFNDPGAGNYWSTTFWGTTTAQNLAVNNGTGALTLLLPDSATAGFWCVRGGRGYDGVR